MGDRANPEEPTITASAATGRERLGPYRLEAVLGTGGMGVVYRGAAPGGAPVAIKALQVERAEAETVQRFAREASIRINHRNVIRVLDAGADSDGTPFIVLELLEGESLKAKLERDVLSPEELLEIAVQAGEGLAAAHRVGVIHRDLKPANIFCCNDGTVKVLDFGIAHVAGAAQLTTDGTVIGTPQYFSPEQAQGERQVDARSDVWGFGAVLYEGLCGSPPFARDSHFATMLAIVMEEVPRLRARAPHVPKDLARVVERCLQKDRHARWADAEELSQALRSIDLRVGATEDDSESTRVPSIRPDEDRIVAIMLARRVHDMSLLEQAVQQRGGVLIPLLGTDAIGLFGAERWEGDEVSCAVGAALHSRHAAELVSVGSGRAHRSKAGISGDAMRAAERGCVAQLIGVAVDPETARALGSKFSIRRVDEGLYEVVGERSASAPPGPGEGVIPTIGREPQIAQLRSALESVIEEGRACVVAVSGPVGVGKTRLRHEMERLLASRNDPVRVLTGRGEPQQRQSRLSLLASALQRRAQRGTAREGWPRLNAEAPLAERRQAVLFLTREAIVDPAAAYDRAAFLGELLGVSMPDSTALQAARADPQLMADRIKLAVQDYVRGLSEQGPLALLFEDLHCADDASIRVLGGLLEQLREKPLLLMGTSRVDLRKTHGEPFGGDAMHITLRGLAPAMVRRLAEHVTGRDIDERLAQVLAQRTEGNPLFVEQVALALVDRGVLDTSEPEQLPLPVTVEAAVQSRLDHLPEPERELCKRASVFGRPFRAEELRLFEQTGESPDGAGPLAVRLESLVQRDIFVRQHAWSGPAAGPEPPEPDGEYVFRSALMRDIAYRIMSSEMRARLHREAAQWLAGRPGSDSEEVAVHFEQAGDETEAARLYTESARDAARRGDSATMERCARRALELGPPAEGLYELHVLLADALRFLGVRDEQKRQLDAALEHAGGDAERARVRTDQTSWHAREGRLGEALQLAHEAVAAAERSAEPEARALAYGSRAEVHMFAGRVEDAEADVRRASGLAEQAGPLVRALVAEWEGLLASTRGDPGAAHDAYGRAVARYRQAGDVRHAAANQQNLADAYNRLGAYAEAELALRDALEGCQRVGNRLVEGYVLANLGYAQAMQHRFSDALESLEQAEVLVERTGDARLRVFIRIYRARALLGAGRDAEALIQAEEAAGRAKELGQPALEVMAWTLASRAELEMGNVERALERARTAFAMRDELGGIEEDEGEVFVGFARALEAAGQLERAEGVRRRGAQRVRDIAAQIADAHWREQFIRQVPAHRELQA